ncbi:MAG: carbohydrate-binding protein [Clostridiales bacterium]|jgi:hypothetical protein|nr:carbohydrate-binding protein [Eubacteriales bacterium]MDH7565466.1 carbohydrate-binding protein [Clostridiales bacterium]
MGTFDVYFKQEGITGVRNPGVANEEYSTELYEKVFDTRNVPPFNSYSSNGIQIEKYPDRMRVFYDGILSQNGADGIFAYVGTGDSKNWGHTACYPMHVAKQQRGFEVLIPAKSNQTINLAFKDSAGHWDNNSGMNYTFNNSFYGGSH